MNYLYRPPSWEDILSVAADMRDTDVLEVAASSGHSPLEALVESVGDGGESFCLVVDGTPVCIFGVGGVSSTEAVVWLLCARSAYKYPKLLWKEAKRILTEWQGLGYDLYNYVAADNDESQKWLRSLGFTVEGYKHLGPMSELFVRMELPARV